MNPHWQNPCRGGVGWELHFWWQGLGKGQEASCEGGKKHLQQTKELDEDDGAFKQKQKEKQKGSSLVVQWLRICLAKQGTGVQFLHMPWSN